MTSYSSIDCIAIGQICRQTIVTLNHKIYERILSGPALYAVAGLKSCSDHIGIISAIPPGDNEELQRLLKKFGVDHRNILLSNAISIEEQFLGYFSPYSPPSLQPIPYFSSLHLTLPTSMRSTPVEDDQKSRAQNYFPTELSPIYLNASAAHICAADINYQVKACSLLDKTAISVLTLLSSPAYMIPSQWELVMNLMNGLSLFITTRQQLFSLFKNRTNDIDEMGKILHAHGCTYLVLINDADGYELNDFQKKKTITVPNYPSSITDPTGTDEVFCGGLLAEMRRSHDPVQAVICGSVMASLKAEGCGPFYPLEAAPGLLEARIQRIKDWVKV